MNTTEMAKFYAGGRVAIGVLLLLAPGRLLRDLAGSNDRRAKAMGRMLGVRDLLLGAGALSTLQGGQGKAPIRPWMTYAAVADATDAFALLLAYRELPRRRRAFFVAMALAGASTGGYLVTQLDD